MFKAKKKKSEMENDWNENLRRFKRLKIFPTYKSIPLKGYKLGEIRKREKRKES